MNTSKLNIVLASVFILALVALGWLIIKSTGLKPPIATTNYSPDSQNIQTTPTNIEPTTPPFERAIDANIIKSLSMIKKGILDKSILENTYSGTVTKVLTTGGYAPANNFKFKIMIALKNSQGEQNTFYYNDRESTILQGPIESLKSGDKITIFETIDLQKPQEENIVALSITKQ